MSHANEKILFYRNCSRIFRINEKKHDSQNYTLLALALTYYLRATKGEIYPLV